MPKEKRYFGQSKALYSIPELMEDLKSGFPDGKDGKVVFKLANIVIAHPADKLAKSQIIPKLNYVHHRSEDDSLDFFYAGMIPESKKEKYLDDELMKMPKVGKEQWYFSDYMFVQMIKFFEQNINWKYQSGSDMLIFNYTVQNGDVRFLWDTSLLLNLEQAVERKAIPSVSRFIESLIRFVREKKSQDPSFNFALSQMGKLAKGSLLKTLSSFIPNEIINEYLKYDVFIPLDAKKYR